MEIMPPLCSFPEFLLSGAPHPRNSHSDKFAADVPGFQTDRSKTSFWSSILGSSYNCETQILLQIQIP